MATLAAAASVTATVLVAVAVFETVLPEAFMLNHFMVRLAVKEFDAKLAGTVNVGELVVELAIVILLLAGGVTFQL